MYKRLTRSRTQKVIAGVAAGFANYFNIDPVLVRILFVAVTLASFGIGIFIYIICWIAIPEEQFVYPDLNSSAPPRADAPAGDQQSEPPPPPPGVTKKENNAAIGALILIGLGFLLLFHNLFDIELGNYWPLLIVALGVLILVRSGRKVT